MIRAYADMLYQGTAPFTVDAAAFQDAFGPFEVTPLEVTIAATVSWFQERAREAAAAA